METLEVERSKTIIHNLNDVYSKLQELQLGDWTLLKKETNLYLLYIEESPAPVIKCYIKISEGLVITLNYQNQELKRSPNKTYTFPFLTNNINDLGNLSRFENFIPFVFRFFLRIWPEWKAHGFH
jgi:hypothetical protein